MRRLVGAAVGTVLVASVGAPMAVADDGRFSDVPATHVFVEEIGWSATTGLAEGYADGSFRPSAPVTRQAIAAFFHRQAGAPPFDGEAPFSDVPASHPFAQEIGWLAAEGLADGYPDGSFRPGAPVTRQAVAAFFHRHADAPWVHQPGGFSDVASLHPFAQAIGWFGSSGLTTGYPDGSFRPAGVAERQAVAAFFFRRATSPVVSRVSVTSDGGFVGSGSEPAISADGRYIAFVSRAPGLLPGGAHEGEEHSHVFVHDVRTGRTELVSTSSDGTPASGRSFSPSISADGRHVAFNTRAPDLVEDDGHRVGLYVHDRETGERRRVDVSSTGEGANRSSRSPQISADGRYVAFHSEAMNLVPEDPHAQEDIFVHDLHTGRTELVSLSPSGQQWHFAPPSSVGAPAISADGRFVAFENPDGVFVRDRVTDETEPISGPGATHPEGPSISADGRLVAFESDASDLVDGDTNGVTDVFVYDRQTGETERVSVASDGTQASGRSSGPSISADGRHVAFLSFASDLVEGDTNTFRDVFVHDRGTGATTLLSVSSSGDQADGASFSTATSADGRYVAFSSNATNLAPGNTRRATDVYVAQRW